MNDSIYFGPNKQNSTLLCGGNRATYRARRWKYMTGVGLVAIFVSYRHFVLLLRSQAVRSVTASPFGAGYVCNPIIGSAVL
jgi:hypothetical protein